MTACTDVCWMYTNVIIACTCLVYTRSCVLHVSFFYLLGSKGSLCITEIKDVLDSLFHPETAEQTNLTCRCINRINIETPKASKTSCQV